MVEFTHPAGLGLRSLRAIHLLSEDEIANPSLCLDKGARPCGGWPAERHPTSPSRTVGACWAEWTPCKFNQVVAAEVTLTVSRERRPGRPLLSLTPHPSSPPDQHTLRPEYKQWYLISSGNHRRGEDAGGGLRPLLVLLFKAFFVLSTLGEGNVTRY